MTATRLLYGLDRLPRGLAPDDMRLPGVALTAAPLRLNTVPLPPDVVAAGEGGHAARLRAAEAWLGAACGPYAPLRRRFVAAYLAWAASEVTRHRDALAAGLARFGGLYMPEDWLWSAPRPLPRALVPVGEELVPVDLAFWDGTRILAVLLGSAPDLPPADGVDVCRLAAADLADPAALAARLPDGFRRFWEGETLPVTPFRRALPEIGAAG